MDMFEDKDGYRIYRRKKDAEFLAILAREREDCEAEIFEVKVKDGDLAKRKGFTVHPDISISASPPKKGLRGWIVQKEDEDALWELGDAVEIIE